VLAVNALASQTDEDEQEGTMHLFRAIRTKRPGSIYELANITGRKLKNIQDDLRLLERYGLVRIGHGRSSGKRRVRIPQAVFNEIALRIAT